MLSVLASESSNRIRRGRGAVKARWKGVGRVVKPYNGILLSHLNNVKDTVVDC